MWSGTRHTVKATASAPRPPPAPGAGGQEPTERRWDRWVGESLSRAGGPWGPGRSRLSPPQESDSLQSLPLSREFPTGPWVLCPHVSS